MGYEDWVNQNDEDHKAVELTSTLIKWDDIGRAVVGKLLQIEEFRGEKYDAVCNSYLLDTDDGMVSFLLGSSTDKKIDAENLINHVIKIRFDGKLDLGDGRKVNQFRIWDYGIAP